MLNDPLVTSSVRLDDKQRAALGRLFRESTEAEVAHFREMGKKMLDVLTPEQKEKLPDAVDKIQVEAEEEAQRQMERQKSGAATSGVGGTRAAIIKSP